MSSAGVEDEAPGTFRTRRFWVHSQHPVSLSGPCSSWAAPVPLCLGQEPTAPGRGRGYQWGWGAASARWRNRAHTHHCCVCTPQHPPPPRWHPFTAWRIILQRLFFLLLINRAGVIFPPFCFYHHPLGLFSSNIKLSLALIHLSQISQKLWLFTVCEEEGGSTLIYK